MGDSEEAAPRHSAAHRPGETTPSQRDEDRRDAVDEDDLDRDGRDEETGARGPGGDPRTPPDEIFHG